MNVMENELNNGKPKPYPSIAALKEAHTFLLKRNREGDTNNFFNDVETFLTRGSLTGKLIDDYSDREAGQSLLDYWVTVLLRARRGSPDATLAEFDSSLSPRLDDSLCPYKGLNAFQETDYDIFYGRQRLIDTLISEIKEKNILFVVGPSGSGKSSLVLAGVLSALKNGVLQSSENWYYVPRIVPGVNPLKNLAAALGFSENENQIIERFKENSNYLSQIIETRVGTSSVLVVDQFEEIFTLCNDETLRAAFIENLITLTGDSRRNHKVIFTLRTDYETYVAGIPSLASIYEGNHVRVTPLTSADLRKAIEEPAKRIGLKFEQGIVDALIKDILGEPAGLPLLQFALLQLWENRENKRNRITWRNYRELGDARQALSLTAEKFYNGLIPEKQEAARRILLKMVRPSEGLEVTSNRVKRSELYRFGIPKYRIEEVLEELIKQGLVRLTKGDVPENDQFEVAHEALIRSWEQLGDWLNDERVNMRQRIRLNTAARQWLEHGKDEGSLLGGKVLEEALQYDDLDELEREFVETSQAAVAAAELEKTQALERERKLEHEKLIALEERAAEESKNARRLRRFAVALALIAAFAVVAAGFALVNYKKANDNYQKSEREKEAADKARQKVDDINAQLTEQSGKLENALKEATKAGTEAETARKEAEKQTILANERFKEAQAARKIAEDQTRLAESQQELIAQKNNELNKANTDLKTANENLAVLREKEEQKSIAKSLLIKANAELEAKKFDEAKMSYSSLLANPVLSEEPEMKLDVLKGTAKTYYYLSENQSNISEDQKKEYYSKFEENSQAAESIFTKEIEKTEKESGKDSSELLQALVKRAEFYRSQKYSELEELDTKAEADYKQALSIQEEVVKQDPMYYNIEAYDKLVESILEIHKIGSGLDLDAAKELFKNVLEFKRTLKEKDSSILYAELNKTAEIYTGIENYDEAIPLYKEALDTVREEMANGSVFHSLYERDLLNSLRSLANTYFEISNNSSDRDLYKDAELLYLESLQVEENIKEEFNKDSAGTAFNLAEIYNRKENYPDAIKYYRLAQNFYKTDPDSFKKNLLSIQDKLTGVYLKQNNPEAFNAGYDDLMKLIESSGQRYILLVGLLKERADIADEKGDVKEATEFYEKALNLIIKSTKSRTSALRRQYGLNEIVKRLSAIYHSQNELEKAYDLTVDVYGEYSTSSLLVDNTLKLAESYEKKDIAKAENLYKKILGNFKEDLLVFNYESLINVLEAYSKMLSKIPERKKEVEQIQERIKKILENNKAENSK